MKFSIRTLFIILLFCGIFYFSLKPVVDPDFWWHLRTGQLIDQTQAIPYADPFSYTANAKQWITHEWLSEILIYQAYNLGGYVLLILIFSGITTISFLLSYICCPNDSKPYIAGFITLLGVTASLPIWGVRPQMFTLLFSGLFLLLYDRYRANGNFLTLIPIPIITMLWVNLHAGYIIGIVIEIIYLVGYFLEIGLLRFRSRRKIDGATRKSIWIQVGILITSILAALINPVGFRILSYPFQTLNDSAMQSYIQEWFSPDFHQLIWQPFAVMLLVLIGVGMIGKRSFSMTKVLLTLAFGFGALRSMRNIPLFALVVIPVIADQLSAFIRIKPKPQNPSRVFRWIAPILLSGAAVVLILATIQVTNIQPKAESDAFPKNAVEWVLENKPTGNVFNSYNWGGYIIWKLFPEYLVYIDGRADLYGEEFVSNYAEIYHAKIGWEDKLDQAKIQIVFIESDSLMADALRQSPNWKILFEDDLSVIFNKE